MHGNVWIFILHNTTFKPTINIKCWKNTAEMTIFFLPEIGHFRILHLALECVSHSSYESFVFCCVKSSIDSLSFDVANQ